MPSWLVLASACAAFVAPDTTTAIINQESGGDVLAIHVNGLKQQPPAAQNAFQAAQIAVAYIARGYSVDLGLMQINSRNLPALRMQILDAFSPCANIHAGATILAANYIEASRTTGPGRTALLAALSAYNTGNFYEGFLNGYVGRYSLIPSGLMEYAHEQAARRSPRVARTSKESSGQATGPSSHIAMAGTVNAVAFYQ